MACLAGAVFSSLLYMIKGIIELMIGGSALVPAFVANIPKLMTSPPNIIIAVVVAMAFLPALQKAMNSTSFGRHMVKKVKGNVAQLELRRVSTQNLLANRSCLMVWYYLQIRLRTRSLITGERVSHALQKVGFRGIL